MLVKNDLIHRLAEVYVNLVEESDGVIRALATEVLGGLSKLQNAVGLVGVDVWNLVFWHVFNVVAILDKGISVDSVLISLFKPTAKNTRILIIEHYVDAIEAATLFRVFPVAFVAFRFR